MGASNSDSTGNQTNKGGCNYMQKQGVGAHTKQIHSYK